MANTLKKVFAPPRGAKPKLSLKRRRKHENRLVKHKWVRVMCDFAAHGIWEKGGASPPLADLPVDADTFFELGEWQFWFESRKHDEPIRNLEKFVSFGWDIVWSIKRQLPDWTVVYHDEKRGEDLIGFRLWLKHSK